VAGSEALLPARRLDPLGDGTAGGEPCSALHRLDQPCRVLSEGVSQDEGAASHVMFRRDEQRRARCRHELRRSRSLVADEPEPEHDEHEAQPAQHGRQAFPQPLRGGP
jgi:hypothetical protein